MIGIWWPTTDHRTVSNYVPEPACCERPCHMMDDILWLQALKKVQCWLHVLECFPGSSNHSSRSRFRANVVQGRCMPDGSPGDLPVVDDVKTWKILRRGVVQGKIDDRRGIVLKT